MGHAGVTVVHDYFSLEEEVEIVGKIELDISSGCTQRNVRRFGWTSLIDERRVEDPIPDWILDVERRIIRDTLVASDSASVRKCGREYILPWHTDSPLYTDPVIMASFCGPILLEWMDDQGYHALEIVGRDLVIMDGVRLRHQVRMTQSVPRYALMFRRGHDIGHVRARPRL